MAFLMIFITLIIYEGMDLKLIINRKRVVNLNLILVPISMLSSGFVFIFFGRQSIVFWVLRVNFPSSRR